MLMRDWACAAGFVAILVVALGCTLLWAFSDFLIDLPQCHSGDPNQLEKTQTQKNSTTPSLPLSHLVPPDQTQTKAAEPSNKYYECLLADYTRKLAGFTKWLAIATVFLVICTAGLVWVARRQFIDARVVQRAHVYVRNQHSEFLLDQSGNATDLRVWVTLKNSGPTPAAATSAHIGVTYAQNITNFRFGVPPGGVQQPLVLGPDQEIDLGFFALTIAVDHLFSSAVGRFCCKSR
jgi:hypothetical protein